MEKRARRKAICKLIVAILYGFLGLFQLGMIMTGLILDSKETAPFIFSAVIPMLGAIPIFVCAIIDALALIKTISKSGKGFIEKLISYKKNYNTLICVLLCIFSVIYGIVVFVNGFFGFLIGAIGEGVGPFLTMVAVGYIYMFIAPVVLIILFICEIVFTAGIHKISKTEYEK